MAEEKITEWGCRTVDDLRGVVAVGCVSRKDAEMEVAYHRRIYATRGTYTGRAELVRRQVHTDPWEVVSDNSEVPNAGD